MYIPSYSGLSEVYIYDISDKSSIELMRKVSFEGDYLSSRKIDDMVYLVANKYTYYWGYEEGDNVVPLYSDSSAGDVETVCGCEEILYRPDGESDDFIVVAGIPTINPLDPVSEQVIVGSTTDIYASRDHLYVAEQKYDWGWYNDDSDEETIVHKFDLDREDVEYLGKGNVPGTILNQFSMDEHDGNFRIATTLGDVWDSENLSTNNLYILDENMERVSEIEGIAPGERIYSVRFMGDRAYMVTFKKVDPFFVIDVADPGSPEILGKLKIPGYSDYLHPYGENYVIGFGKDTEAASEEEIEARGIDFAWYQGMKVAMFDVTDVSNPIELHKMVIGDRGTNSELLYNHKALLFDEAKGLMAFPVTVAQLPESEKVDPQTSGNIYGDFVFQGAHIYNVSVDGGFELKGTITHYDSDEVEELSGYYWNGDKDIDRILYIGDFLYTVSQGLVKANGMEYLEDVSEVELN